MREQPKLGKKGQGHASQLQGQAGVYAVSSQLCLRGYFPLFPAVDYGYDLMLEGGLRIQVKTSRLKFHHKNYPDGSYCFEFRKFNWDSSTKRIRNIGDYAKCADFFILWGIDENRFWIVPTSYAKTATWFSRIPMTTPNRNPQFDAIRKLKASWENNWDALNIETSIEALAITVPGAGEYEISAEVKPKEKP